LPLIKAETEPYKQEPERLGGMQIPNLDKQIYNKVDKTMGFAIDGVEENLEQLPNEDDLNQQLIDEQDKKEQIQEIISRKKAVPEPAKPQTEAEVKAKRIDVDKVLAKKEPTEIWIQLGTFEEESDATKAWQDVREKNADALADVGTRVTKSEADGGIYYRLQSGPIYSEDEAKALCDKLSARGQTCFYAKKDAQ
jgi:cell division septation protein DedD